MQQTSGAARRTAGDDRRAAFAAFYERHGDQLVRTLSLTLGDRELGRDATQEAMVRAWKAWDKVGGYDNPAGWVYRVGLNWGRSRLRRLSRELLGRTADHRTHRHAEPEPTDPALVEALAALPHRHRAVVVLRMYLDWSVDEVAAALGIPAGTVRSRQHTAIKKLHERLEIRP